MGKNLNQTQNSIANKKVWEIFHTLLYDTATVISLPIAVTYGFVYVDTYVYDEEMMKIHN